MDKLNLGALVEAHGRRFEQAACVTWDWAKGHPKKTALAGAGLVAMIFRHHRKKANDNIGAYAGTIMMGDQSMPSGSSAGMNNAAGAYIQPAQAGYDNPVNQGARYGFKRSSRRVSQNSIISRPQAYRDYSSMANYNYDMGNVNQDQQFSRMI